MSSQKYQRWERKYTNSFDKSYDIEGIGTYLTKTDGQQLVVVFRPKDKEDGVLTLSAAGLDFKFKDQPDSALLQKAKKDLADENRSIKRGITTFKKSYFTAHVLEQLAQVKIGRINIDQVSPDFRYSGVKQII